MSENLSPDLTKTGILYRFEIFVPIIDNDKNLIDTDLFDELTGQLTEVFGGVSANYPYGGSGGIDGMWYSSVAQLTHHDHSAVFMVLAKGENKSISFFQKNLPEWERKFGQEKILVMFHGIQTL